jgi:hypothetical protein
LCTIVSKASIRSFSQSIETLFRLKPNSEISLLGRIPRSKIPVDENLSVHLLRETTVLRVFSLCRADVIEVARAVVKVVDMPFGTRPFRVHIDPANDGASVVNAVADRIRVEFLRNIGLADILRPSRQ